MSNITPGHVRVFQAVRSQLYDNITLASCTINGEPGVAIIMVDEVGEGKIAVMPLFCRDHAKHGPQLSWRGPDSSSGGGGGPKNPREAFDANKSMTSPAQGESISQRRSHWARGFTGSTSSLSSASSANDGAVHRG